MTEFEREAAPATESDLVKRLGANPCSPELDDLDDLVDLAEIEDLDSDSKST